MGYGKRRKPGSNSSTPSRCLTRTQTRPTTRAATVARAVRVARHARRSPCVCGMVSLAGAHQEDRVGKHQLRMCAECRPAMRLVRPGGPPDASRTRVRPGRGPLPDAAQGRPPGTARTGYLHGMLGDVEGTSDFAVPSSSSSSSSDLRQSLLLLLTRTTRGNICSGSRRRP